MVSKTNKAFTSTINFTEKQQAAIEFSGMDRFLWLKGSAGTGKTFISVYCAFKKLLDGEVDKIVIIKGIVPTRDIGHLPGSEAEKCAPYFDYYEPMFYSVYEELKARYNFPNGLMLDTILNEKIIFKNTSHLRGSTFDDSFVILDEYQNLTKHEINTVATRIGYRSFLNIVGDSIQCDNKEASKTEGFLNNVIYNMDRFGVVEFDNSDIVRSGFVKEWLEVADKYLMIQG